MSTFTPNELTYPVTPPAIDAAGLTTTYGEAVRGITLTVARGAVESAEEGDAQVATGVRPAGVRL